MGDSHHRAHPRYKALRLKRDLLGCFREASPAGEDRFVWLHDDSNADEIGDRAQDLADLIADSDCLVDVSFSDIVDAAYDYIVKEA